VVHREIDGEVLDQVGEPVLAERRHHDGSDALRVVRGVWPANALRVQHRQVEPADVMADENRARNKPLEVSCDDFQRWRITEVFIAQAGQHLHRRRQRTPRIN